MEYKHNPNLTKNAKYLRKNMTKEEKRLWYEFLRTYHVRFLRQKVIDNYIADFYCSKAKLVIEVDGAQHYKENERKHDVIRTERLNGRDLLVIRIPNSEINKNFSNVCDYIDLIVKTRIAE